MRYVWIRLATTLGLLASFAAAQGAVYQIEPDANTRFELVVKKTGFLSGKEHLFVFPKLSGEVRYDEKAPEKSAVTLRIDASSIECRDDWVNEKDRVKIMREATEKMLRVQEHREMLFSSTAIERHQEGAYTVRGNLTIRGVAKPVAVMVKMTPAGGALSFNGDATIDMTEWGLKPPSALLGAIGTDKNMQVRFSLKAVK